MNGTLCKGHMNGKFGEGICMNLPKECFKIKENLYRKLKLTD